MLGLSRSWLSWWVSGRAFPRGTPELIELGVRQQLRQTPFHTHALAGRVKDRCGPASSTCRFSNRILSSFPRWRVASKFAGTGKVSEVCCFRYSRAQGWPKSCEVPASLCSAEWMIQCDRTLTPRTRAVGVPVIAAGSEHSVTDGDLGFAAHTRSSASMRCASSVKQAPWSLVGT
jgi:hypothetical protein